MEMIPFASMTTFAHQLKSLITDVSVLLHVSAAHTCECDPDYFWTPNLYQIPDHQFRFLPDAQSTLLRRAVFYLTPFSVTCHSFSLLYQVQSRVSFPPSMALVNIQTPPECNKYGRTARENLFSLRGLWQITATWPLLTPYRPRSGQDITNAPHAAREFAGDCL